MIVDDLLPPPSVVRERLALVQREAAVLRRLLRLSSRAVAEADEHRRAYRADPTPDGAVSRIITTT